MTLQIRASVRKTVIALRVSNGPANASVRQSSVANLWQENVINLCRAGDAGDVRLRDSVAPPRIRTAAEVASRRDVVVRLCMRLHA